MLSKKQVLDAVKGGRGSECIDGRDYSRLTDFFDTSEYEHFGFKLKDGAKTPEPVEWTEEAVKNRLKGDLSFAFDKALGQRGLSAGMMHEVVKMWMWVLEDELQNDDDYAQYGLPLFKKVAVKYGLENEIGEDYGNESKYSCGY